MPADQERDGTEGGPTTAGHEWPDETGVGPAGSRRGWRGDDPDGPAAPPYQWLDDDAGPVVRPYTMTGGRVQPAEGRFDLMAFVVAGPPEDVAAQPLQPEHRAIIGMAQRPVSVADVAADLDLPVGVVRVLLGDLLATGGISMYEPPAERQFPDDDILKAVVNGLRAL